MTFLRSPQAAEFVGPGHPDKIADIIADTLVEKALQKDLWAQCAFEVLVSKDLVVVAGELGGNVKVSDLKVNEVVEKFFERLDYNTSELKIITNIKEQSPEIRSTSIEKEGGIVSGDQSICIGYACLGNDFLLPKSYMIARKLITSLYNLRATDEYNWANYDCKSLVSLKNEKIEELILSVQHEDSVEVEEVREVLKEYAHDIIKRIFELDLKEAKKISINSSGKFIIGGLDADTGITNRKLMVDSYGTISRHGGGGLCGKDLTKVDRLGSYYARWICVNMVASRVCQMLELQLIYEYGASKPTFQILNMKSKYSKKKIQSIIETVFTFTFDEIYRRFNKSFMKYSTFAEWGHFGHYTTEQIPWERQSLARWIKCFVEQGGKWNPPTSWREDS